jgi:hypothetical protein
MTLQTGPNIQFVGLKNGLFKDAYQSPGIVSVPIEIPAPITTTKKIRKEGMFFIIDNLIAKRVINLWVNPDLIFERPLESANDPRARAKKQAVEHFQHGNGTWYAFYSYHPPPGRQGSPDFDKALST